MQLPKIVVPVKSQQKFYAVVTSNLLDSLIRIPDIDCNEQLFNDRQSLGSAFVSVLANKQQGRRRISDPWGRTKAAKRRPRIKNQTTSRHLCRRMNRRKWNKKMTWRYVFENRSFFLRTTRLFEGMVLCLILWLFDQIYRLLLTITKTN